MANRIVLNLIGMGFFLLPKRWRLPRIRSEVEFA